MPNSVMRLRSFDGSSKPAQEDDNFSDDEKSSLQKKGESPSNADKDDESIVKVILMLVVHLCRTVLYGLDISHRACVYLLGVLVISLLSDYITPSADGNYFAQTDNFLNLLFAKWAWLWTCLL